MTEIGHVKIAVTTNDLLQVDANFANARQIVFYDISAEGAEFLDCAQFKGGARAAKRGPGGGAGCSMGDANDGATVDQVQIRVDALEGCHVLFTLALSDFAAVSVKNNGVFPVKMEKKREVQDVIDSLQHMMRKNPPLWLRKAMRCELLNPSYQLLQEA